MKELPKFAILANGELGGKIILLERPYIIASVYSCKRDDEKVQELMEDMVQGRYPISKVKGYTVFFRMYSSLEPCNDEDLQTKVLKEMADFFLEEKIKQKPGQYMKSEETGAIEERIVMKGRVMRERKNRIKKD